jgi:hypothetical protein
LHVAGYRIKKLIKLGTFNSELDTCNSQRATGYWMLDKIKIDVGKAKENFKLIIKEHSRG